MTLLNRTLPAEFLVPGLHTPVFRSIILLVLVALCSNTVLAAPGPFKFPNKFYENQERSAVSEFLRAIAANPKLGTKNNTGFRIQAYRTMGFMARVARDHPDWISDWITLVPNLHEPMRLVVIMAIASANSNESQMALSQWEKTGQSKIIALVRTRDLTTLLNYKVINPDILNTFDGAYQASGDEFFLSKILNGFAISLPFGSGPKKPNAVMSHIIPATMISLYRTDKPARDWFDEQIRLNTDGVGDLLAKLVRAKSPNDK